MGALSYFLLVARILPLVTNLIVIAEKLFDDVPESGEQKKEMVMSGVKSVVMAIISLSTGGQQETWIKLEPFISQMVDAICGVLFPSEEE